MTKILQLTAAILLATLLGLTAAISANFTPSPLLQSSPTWQLAASDMKCDNRCRSKMSRCKKKVARKNLGEEYEESQMADCFEALRLCRSACINKFQCIRSDGEIICP